MRSFEPGDIIVSRAHLKDWLKWALRVDSVDGDGTVRAYLLGGGFEYEIDPVKVEKYDFVKVPAKLLNNASWKSEEFFAEWFEKKYRGWSSGQRWNGWAMPYFEFDEAMKYSQDSEKLGAGFDAVTLYDPARDAFVTRKEDGDEVDEATVILVKGRGALKVYPIGTGSWTWSIAPEEDDPSDNLGGTMPSMGISAGNFAAFSSPSINMTSGAKAAFEESGEQPAKYLDRHFSGDFGEVNGTDDLQLNLESLKRTGMVMSIYTLSTGVRFYIITDEGHQVTTLLLPEEY